LHIRAPSDGTVALLVAAPGEAIIPAQPLMTLQKAAQHWTSFKFARGPVRRFAYGSRVELIPASGNALINARIDEIVPRGEFATWRAAGFEPLVPLATKMLIELVRTMTALVLGLLIASANSFYNNQKSSLEVNAAKLLQLDNVLRRYARGRAGSRALKASAIKTYDEDREAVARAPTIAESSAAIDALPWRR
jgi:hypothetical protein